MATIFHLALASDWEAAKAAGSYTMSTRGRTLAEEGFIHASRGDQWPGVRDRFYAAVTEPLVLLQIDTDRLGVPVIEEPAVPGGTETFPHIYGPLPVAAVVKAIPLTEASRPAPPATTQAAATADRAPQSRTPQKGRETFSQTYFTEMFYNAGLVLLAMLLGVAGAGIGSAMSTYGGESHDWVRLVGALIGLAIGAALATFLYRRRARRSR